MLDEKEIINGMRNGFCETIKVDEKHVD